MKSGDLVASFWPLASRWLLEVSKMTSPMKVGQGGEKMEWRVEGYLSLPGREEEVDIWDSDPDKFSLVNFMEAHLPPGQVFVFGEKYFPNIVIPEDQHKSWEVGDEFKVLPPESWVNDILDRVVDDPEAGLSMGRISLSDEGCGGAPEKVVFMVEGEKANTLKDRLRVLVRLHQAIVATRRLIPGYFEKTLAQRAELSGEAAGSVYEGVAPWRLEAMLFEVVWAPHAHPAIAEGCSAFRAAIPGRLGIVELRALPSETVVTLDDRKGTGKVSVTVEGVRGEVVDFTVLILGPEKNTDGVNEEVVYTFHPGDPIRPSQVQAEPGLHGKKITVQEALGLGLEMAKIV